MTLTAFAMPVFAQATYNYQKSAGTTAYTSQASSGWQNLGPAGTWWRNQKYVSVLSLTTDQQKRMDEVFQQNRIKLIDLTATLDKEEASLEPMLQADRLDEIRVVAQIDKVANARAELEKSNAKMLLGIRQVLTPEQWTTLNSSKLGGYSDAIKERTRAKVAAKAAKPKP
jgi:Spy/CpxP family protein refolding chaperone